jgi:ubiquinone/menaquinone biosynthesis C-methylase UbiE
MIRKLPSAVIVAMDLSLNMLERARKNIADEQLQDRILLILADAQNLPFKDDSLDLVYSHSVFHHLVDPMIAVKGIIRVAKQGCCFIVQDLRRPPGFLLEWYVRIFGFRYDEMMKKMYRESLHAGFTHREMAGIVGRIKCAVAKTCSFFITHVGLEGIKTDSGRSVARKRNDCITT